jgi:hypothetical protein
MTETNGIWVHKASFTYSVDPPESIIETIWAERKGWGFLKSRDMWIHIDADLAQLRSIGYFQRKPPHDPSVRICPHCRMYSDSIPGALMKRHENECRGSADEWIKVEETLITDIRRQQYEKAILDEIRRQKEEEEERERRERFGKIREDALARQSAKDRKKRLKQEARQALRKGPPAKK